MQSAAELDRALEVAIEGEATVANGQARTAIRLFREALKLAPDHPEILHNLGNALLSLGRVEDAVEAAWAAHAAAPEVQAFQSNLLCTLLFSPSHGAEVIAEAHRQWGQQFTSTVGRRPRRISGRMRIGYLSSCFRKNPEYFFIEPLLRNHNRNRFEVVCLHSSTGCDEFSRQIQSISDRWCDISGLSDDEAARQIRDLDLDILVDCSGHYAESRTRLMGQRLAAVQVSYPTYPATTGLANVDYRISDNLSDPPGMTEHLHSETLARLPEIFTCYAPWKETPEVGPLPMDANGFVTFGSFNRLHKINRKVIATWSSVLRQNPDSRLLIHSTFQGHTVPPSEHCSWVLDEFSRFRVAPGRIKFHGARPLMEYYAVRNQVDIALDPFPFPGLTTTCDSLWMGVPIVSLTGRSHLERTGAAVLRSIGLSDWVANTPEQYVSISVAAAADPTRLRALRWGLRERMARSPLLAASAFTRNVEQIYASFMSL